MKTIMLVVSGLLIGALIGVIANQLKIIKLLTPQPQKAHQPLQCIDYSGTNKYHVTNYIIDNGNVIDAKHGYLFSGSNCSI